jgi:hypothetical protein
MVGCLGWKLIDVELVKFGADVFILFAPFTVFAESIQDIFLAESE